MLVTDLRDRAAAIAPPAGSSVAVVSSVFTPVGSIVYTPCRPIVMVRRRFCTSRAIAANTNGVMSR